MLMGGQGPFVAKGLASLCHGPGLRRGKCAIHVFLGSDGKGSCLVGPSSHLLVPVRINGPILINGRQCRLAIERPTRQRTAEMLWRQIARRRATDASGASC